MDTWASTAAGAFALSENNLYTSDAFRDYLTHLTRDGMLAFTRWGFQPPRESLRLLSLAYQAFQELGEPDLASHVIILRENPENLAGWGSQDTVLIFRKPIQPADLARFAPDWLPPASAKDQLVYAPDVPADNAFDKFLHSPDPAALLARLSLRRLSGLRRPAVLLLHRPGARPLAILAATTATPPTTKSTAPCPCCSG